MQTVSSPYYPHHGHPSDYDPHLHGLKRRYLNLLPPPQVIEICLAFEPHAPVHIKSSIWPLDLNGAITALQAHTRPPPVTKTSGAKSPLTGEVAIKDTSGPISQPTPEPASAASALQSSRLTTPKPLGGDSASTDAASSQPPTQTTASAPPAIYHPPPKVSYPHQPYGYSHPQAAYSHVPYYPPGSSHPAYPYPPAVSYPPQTHTSPPFTNGHPPDPPQASTEDLPSYEEMIVEALLDSGDPEGCAPKDLFSTMASRYPLQTNFRPSASQALQKAFKRGRLEKSSGGKYRLNAAWEGGNTSRRTTRRPQTHSQTTTLMQHAQTTAPHSPFTHAPLVRQPNLAHPHHLAYPYGYPPPPTPATMDENIGEGSDAWEAAQNLLKAINFGGLLQLPNEDEKTTAIPKSDPACTVTTAQPPPTIAAGLDADQSTGMSIERAELQALLALLAAQLGDLVQAGEGIIGGG